MVKKDFFLKKNFNKIKHHITRTIPNIEFKVIKGYDKINTLESFIAQEKIDLISMVLRKPYQANSEKSLVREMILHSKTPLLAIQ